MLIPSLVVGAQQFDIQQNTDAIRPLPGELSQHSNDPRPSANLARKRSARRLTVTSFEVSGACSNVASVNDIYIQAGTTADDRPYYEGQTNGRFVFFDAECDGETINDDGVDRWVMAYNEPSTTAAFDLDVSYRVRCFT